MPKCKYLLKGFLHLGIDSFGLTALTASSLSGGGDMGAAFQPLYRFLRLCSALSALDRFFSPVGSTTEKRQKMPVIFGETT